MDYNVVMKNNYPSVIYSGSGKTYNTLVWDVNKYGSKPSDSTFISLYSLIKIRLDKESKISILNNNTQKLIVGGFISACTGTPYKYDTALTDQVNASTRYTLTGDHAFKVTDINTGDKVMVNHTNSNLLQLIFDFSAFRDGLIAKYELDKAVVLAS